MRFGAVCRMFQLGQRAKNLVLLFSLFFLNLPILFGDFQPFFLVPAEGKFYSIKKN